MAQTRIDRRFAELREQGGKALVVYLTAGDPSLEQTVEVALALAEAGVDVLEIGMPFSDPVADGPTIQAACHRALSSGVTPEGVFEAIERIRSRSEVPIVIMTYVSLVHRKGYEAFARRAREAGADGVLVTDLPVRAAETWLTACTAEGLAPIFLVAPTSTDETIRASAEACGGFLYCVSRAGTTGARTSLPEELPQMLRRIRAQTSMPVCVGFGISTTEHVRAVSALADGAIVGSAMVDRVARATHPASEAAAFARELLAGAR